MAESLLLPLVRGVAGKAADALVQTVTRMCGLDDDRETLKRHLLAVECKLANAEKRSHTNAYLKSWMEKLKAVAYEADDVLDDFQYESLRRKVKIGNSTSLKILGYVTHHSPLLFRFAMSRKLKGVLDKIKELVVEMNTFGLENSVSREERHHPWRQTHSKLDESTKMFGRDDDKEGVVKLLLAQQDQRKVQVLPIFGMGGLGKTTLAKMVYNDQDVQQNFQLKMWHCVSDNFDVTAIVKSIIELAVDALVQTMTRMCGLDDDREMLKHHLLAVECKLASADEKSQTNAYLKSWMEKLKAVAYEADDGLDDFQYEALHREARIGKSTSRKVLSYVTHHNPLLFRCAMSKKIKGVLEKIKELVEEMNTFGIENFVHRQEPQLPWWQTHSKLDESAEIIGRGDDKERVVKLLLDQQDQRKVQVLPIFGMGGLGKMTLAKMVYNDQDVQQHFQLKMWHCVSDNFDVTASVKSIIELAINDLPEKEREALARKGNWCLSSSIELLQKKLDEVIGRKRFLLVRDDVWNEEKRMWEDELKPLLGSVGGPGSVIVVTCRSKQVASIMCTVKPHELAFLVKKIHGNCFRSSHLAMELGVETDWMRIG